jgi:hypothetical protein
MFHDNVVRCSKIDFHIFLPARMRNIAMEHVQAQIGYRFVSHECLRIALTAAHRSDRDGTEDDGNRGLAKLGMCAVEMTETYRKIILEKGTSSKVQDPLFCSLIPNLNRGRQYARPLVQKQTETRQCMQSTGS